MLQFLFSISGSLDINCLIYNMFAPSVSIFACTLTYARKLNIGPIACQLRVSITVLNLNCLKATDLARGGAHQFRGLHRRPVTGAGESLGNKILFP